MKFLLACGGHEPSASVCPILHQFSFLWHSAVSICQTKLIPAQLVTESLTLSLNGPLQVAYNVFFRQISGVV